MSRSSVRLLLDSHALLWVLLDDPKLSETARSLVTDEGNEVFYSPVSLYELLFKAVRGRMRPEAMLLLEAARDSGIDELRLSTPHLVHAARLDWEHGDPWDRILLAQATLEDMDLVSVDKTFDEQTDRRIW